MHVYTSVITTLWKEPVITNKASYTAFQYYVVISQYEYDILVITRVQGEAKDER